MYLVFALIAGLIGGAMSVYMRMELMDPGVQYMCEEGARFIANANVLITAHGLIMVVLCGHARADWRFWKLVLYR